MRSLAFLPVLFVLSGIAQADFSSFTTGPVIEDYGPVADVDATLAIPEGAIRNTIADPLAVQQGLEWALGQGRSFRNSDILRDTSIQIASFRIRPFGAARR